MVRGIGRSRPPLTDTLLPLEQDTVYPLHHLYIVWSRVTVLAILNFMHSILFVAHFVEVSRHLPSRLSGASSL